MPDPQVKLSTEPMTLEQVLAVAAGAPVVLTDQAIALIGHSRAIVDVAVERGDAIYGVTTGVGHARNQRVPADDLAAMQPALVEMHVGAIGDPMPTEQVRAGMVVRLNGFARGGSGVTVEIARALEGMLNNEIHPIVPRAGSVGAGDLGQLALLGRSLLGRGEVEFRGRRVPAADALAETGIAPVTLQPKDALAVISSNALTVGNGILRWRAANRLLDLADLVAASSMEAIEANPSVFDPAVARGRGSPGQEETSENLRAALAGSSRVDPALASVQDPISFRVVPQVHGACRDVSAGLARDLERELNARSDNPLVDVETERILSNGNFHLMNVALSAESLNLALAHVGLLSERRCSQLWDALVSSLSQASDYNAPATPMPDGATPPLLAGLSLRYPIAALYTRLRRLAGPVTLDVPILDLSVEDHATNTAEALATTEEIITMVTEILAVEVLLAVGRLATSSGPEGLGARTTGLVALVSRELGRLDPGTLPDEVHARIVSILSAGLDDLLG